jgi:CubicO group peptidase (beta-lactamase class C family)
MRPASAPLLGGDTMDPLEAYHGRTAQQHQQAFDRLSRQGYRMIALDVYGDPSNARYNAVWVKRPGGAYVAFHGISNADYQGRFNQAVALGHAPVLVAATGSGGATIFAAVFEQGIPGPWLARHGLSQAAFDVANATAVQGGMALRSMAVYGSPGDRRYVAVWHARPAWLRTHLRALSSSVSYQSVFDAETNLPFFRPRLVSVAEDRSIASVFCNDVVGNWVARHGLTSGQYQQEFDSNLANGLMPICVSAGGTGAAARFAAIFAERDVAPARVWFATGTRPAALVAAEQAVETFMKTHSIRSGQLTVARRGTVRLERAYTWSEPGTRRTGVRDRMLLASNSKVFVCAAVQWLYDRRTGRLLQPMLRPTRRVYPLLGFSGPMDARSDTITIQQLVDHRAGYTNNPTDPTYDMRNIARDLGLSRAPTATEVARRIYVSRNLTNAPGAVYSYSNIGYLVASLVVERVSGSAYFPFVRQRLLAPLGITDVAECPTAGPDGRPANQVMPEDDDLGLTVLQPQANTQVADVFGGDGMAKEAALGSCAIASSATALTRFIHEHAVWGMGGRTIARRDGSTPGARSTAVSRDGDIDWVVIFNSRMNFSEMQWNALIDAINNALDDWPDPRLRPSAIAKVGIRVTTKAARRKKA